MSEALNALRGRFRLASESIEKMIADAYDLGYRDGGLAMRDHILQAANAPVSIKAGEVSTPDRSGWPQPPRIAAPIQGSFPVAFANSGPNAHERRVASRAPRGLVRAAVGAALTEKPGASITEVEDIVVGRHPEVARKSVGNQLRQFEGELYRREGKYKWFLVTEADKETARGDDPLAEILGLDERR